MAFTFEKLIVYQKAISFADRICALTEPFPRGYGFLSDQLNRAFISIAAIGKSEKQCRSFERRVDSRTCSA